MAVPEPTIMRSPERLRPEFTEERTVPLELDAELETLMKLPTLSGTRVLNMIAQSTKFP